MTAQISLFLPAGNSLTITATAAAGGAAYVNNTLGDGQFAIAANAVVVLGPFNVSYNYTLLGLPALPTYTINRASDGYDFNNLALLAASGAITQWEGINCITKSSAAAVLTLAAPGTDQNGQMFYVTSQTAFAHTITATTLLNNGGSGVPYTTATFTAKAGASICLCAINGAWNVLSSTNVTLS